MSAAVVTTLVPESSEATTTIERYQAAYRAADRTIAFAETVRVAGIFLAGVLFVSAVVTFQMSPAERSGFPVVCASLIACAVLMILISHALSMGFQTQGQLLETALDSAVNSSPFLSNAQRARIMSLREEAPTVETIRAA
jgi:hypothetical protein